MTPDLTQSRDFFDVLIGNLSLEQHDLHMWVFHPTRKDKLSLFVQTVDAAVAIVDQYADWQCYYGIGLRPHQAYPNPHWRGARNDILALLCACLDIDVLHPIAHTETHLPPTYDDALHLLTEYPHTMQPTLLVDSGYGIQPLWLLKEPEWFEPGQDGTVERDAAETVTRRLWAVAAQAADRHGWKVDSCFDLPRLLRVPGSINWKVPGEPRLCTFRQWQAGTFYPSLGDLLEHCPVVTRKDGSFSGLNKREIPEDIKAACSQIVVNHSINHTLLSLIQTFGEMDVKWRRTWEKTRRDLTKDTTQSAWDLSVAVQCANAHLEPQNIADILVHYRTKHGKKEQETRSAYLRWTVETALAGARKGRTPTELAREAQQSHQDEEKKSEEAQTEADDESDPTRLYKEISYFWELPPEWALQEIVYVQADPPSYRFVLQNGTGPKEFTIPLEATLLLSNMSKHVMSLTRHPINTWRKTNNGRWHEFLKRIAALCKKTEVQKDLLTGDILLYHLKSWLHTNTRDPAALREAATDDYLDILRTASPFKENSNVFVSVEGFYAHLAEKKVTGFTRKDIQSMFRQTGGTPLDRAVQWKRQGQSWQCRYWKFTEADLYPPYAPEDTDFTAPQ